MFNMFYKLNISIFFLFMFFPAQASFLEDNSRGWFWFETLTQEVKKEKPELLKKKESPANTKITPIVLMEGIQRELKNRLYKAILLPTQENIKAYQAYQKKVMDQSEYFSKKWMESIYLNPELDYTLGHPTFQPARHIYTDAKQRKIEEQIRKLSKEYGLFFFFSSRCEFCHGFAPIVKAFSKKYGWEVLLISMDGGKIPGFTNIQANNGIAQRLGIRHLPTLLAVHPKTEQIIPLSVGMSSQEEIEQKIMLLIETGAIHV